MFEWKLEDLKLVNDRLAKINKLKVTDYLNFREISEEYNLEKEISQEDKIKFINEQTTNQNKELNNSLSYVLEAFEKYKNVRNNEITREEFLKWVKKTNNSKVLSINKSRFAQSINFQDIHSQVTAQLKHSYCDFNLMYMKKSNFEHFINIVFHNVLIECERQEQKYYNKTDEFAVLQNKMWQCLNEYDNCNMDIKMFEVLNIKNKISLETFCTPNKNAYKSCKYTKSKIIISNEERWLGVKEMKEIIHICQQYEIQYKKYSQQVKEIAEKFNQIVHNLNYQLNEEIK